MRGQRYLICSFNSIQLLESPCPSVRSSQNLIIFSMGGAAAAAAAPLSRHCSLNLVSARTQSSWIHASHYGYMHHVYMHHGYMHHGYGGAPKLLVSYILDHISDGVEIFREFHTMSNLSVSFNAIIDTNIRQFSAKVGPKSISFLLTR